MLSKPDETLKTLILNERQEHMDRFMAKVHKTESCWIWTASTAAGSPGYGRFWLIDKCIQAHWFLLESEKLERLLSGGMQACHTCDNRPCVRPDHIFIGTQADNTNDCVAKGRQGPRTSWVQMHAKRVLPRGEANHAAKLTEEQARYIKHCPQQVVASLDKKFGVHKVVIYGIRAGTRWKHIE